ncbi:unnamed protein product [Cuscuta epithymum]|uniref:Uncharacterized protein n=1 Tax=Cuscuta epithymum TaxID=186058 RepID=A0AAV0ENS0_9ASTE|nr:unnamed protein product [Cuscuta epithymum]
MLKHCNPSILRGLVVEVLEGPAEEVAGVIETTVTKGPTLPNVDVVEKCFGPQRRSHVICHGGGVTRKYLKGPSCKKAEHEAKLNVKDEENSYLKNRLNTLEDEFQKIKEMLQSQEKKLDINT